MYRQLFTYTPQDGVYLRGQLGWHCRQQQRMLSRRWQDTSFSDVFEVELN